VSLVSTAASIPETKFLNKERKNMPSNYSDQLALVCVLCLSLIATGCSAQWISIALADLPVLTQMALNIATLADTLHSGEQLNPSEAAAIQSISSEASKDLRLLQQLYQDYKANPSVNGLQKIQTVIADLNTSLPELLQAGHIKNPVLSTKVNIAVNLILTTVNTFAALIPENAATASSQRTAAQRVTVTQPKDLKRQWNQQVCRTPGKEMADSASSPCPLQ
jgi:hypothetical protein